MRAWIVAAGTGGHIFPGITLAKEIAKKIPQIDYLFFGTRDRLEAKLIPAENFKLKFLVTPRWKGGARLLRIISLPLIALGFLQVLLELFSNRPRFILSIGGYISVPVVLVGALFGVPIFIVEPNIRAGLANRFLSRFAKLGFSTPGSDSNKVMHCPVLDLGNPIRKDIGPTEIRPAVKRITVLGGSQGSLKLGRVVLEAFAKLNLGPDFGISLRVQAGPANMEELKIFSQELEVDVWTQIVPFVNNIPELLSKTDVMISRAGAMSVAEISAASIPTIFVPYPFAADDHQNQNAKILEAAGACLRIDEREGQFLEHIKKGLTHLCIDPANLVKRRELSENLAKFGRPRAAEEIASQILVQLGST